jgi:hypothetical protein
MPNFIENKAKRPAIQALARSIYEKTTLPENQIDWTGIEEQETLKVLKRVFLNSLDREYDSIESAIDAEARKIRRNQFKQDEL